jgi:hypothetical protein
MMVFTFSQAKTLTISPMAIAPTIDGNGDDDWAGVAFVDMLANKGEAANKNNTAKFKITYTVSPAIVFVFVSVEDATLDTMQSANVWEKDCIELFFAMDTANAPAYRTGDLQVRKVYGREMGNDYMAVQKGYKVVEEATATGFTQEWALSIDSMCSDGKGGKKASFNGEMFRFDIANVDNDGSGRNSILFWNSNADDQKNCIKNQGNIDFGNHHHPYYFLEISQSVFSIGISSWTNYVTINSDTYWIANSSQSWLTIDTSSGYGDSKLNLYASANTLKKSRVAYVTITAGSITRTITVTQSGTSNTVLSNLSDANIQLKLSPNPSKDKIQVECSSPFSQVDIFNLEGKLVYNMLSSGTESFITIEGFEEGIYLLKVHTEKGIAGDKFAITK